MNLSQNAQVWFYLIHPESQKGVISIQRGFIENQKGTIAV